MSEELPPFNQPPRPVLLTCPRCHTLLVDKNFWATFPHNAHACQTCCYLWPNTPDWTVACNLSGFILITLTNWLIARGWIEKEIIGQECPELGPLLIRYKLFKSTRLGAIYLHQLLRTDPSPLHDHPWSFISLLLSSGYTEETPSNKIFHRPGSILKRPAHWRHKVEIDAPAWSLVFATTRNRAWGFWPDPDRFIPYQNYDAKAALCPED